MMSTKLQRIWEVDALRGVAVCLMTAQHAAVIWSLFSTGLPSISTLFWYVGRTAAVLFLLLVGVSSVLSHQRRTSQSRPNIWSHFIKRGLFLFLLGMFITILTLGITPRLPIYFGIFHFIGTAVMVAPLFLKWAGLRRAMIILLSLYAVLVAFIPLGSWWLLIVSLPPKNFMSLDYWPLFPWLVVVLIGMELGCLLERVKKYLFFPELGVYFPFNFLSWVGRHSIILYFLHLFFLTLIIWLVLRIF